MRVQAGNTWLVGLTKPCTGPPPNGIKLVIASALRPLRLRSAQGERGGVEIIEQCPLMLSVAAHAAKSKHERAPYAAKPIFTSS